MTRSSALLVVGFAASVYMVVGASGRADAATNTPAPAASAAAKPLREIGRVHARTAFCQAVYDRAGLATSTALDNDASFDQTTRYLNTVELDEDRLGKPRAIFTLQQSYAAIMAASHDAIEQTKALRGLAAQAPTPEQSAALIAYAQALGGAIHRQELVAEYYRRFVQYLETHERVSWQQHNEELFYAARLPLGPFEHSADPRDRVTPLLTEIARSEAANVTERREKVTSDEIGASAQIDAAFGPCASDSSPSPAATH